MRGEHEGGGHEHRAQLVQRRGHKPKLIMPLEHHQHHISLADAEGAQVVGRFVRILLHIGEGKDPFLPLGVAPDHGAAAGVVDGDVVYDIVAEIKAVRAFEAVRGKHPFFVVGFAYISQIDVSHVISTFPS